MRPGGAPGRIVDVSSMGVSRAPRLRALAAAGVLRRRQRLPVTRAAEARVVADQPEGVLGVVLALADRAELVRRQLDLAERVDRLLPVLRRQVLPDLVGDG